MAAKSFGSNPAAENDNDAGTARAQEPSLPCKLKFSTRTFGNQNPMCRDDAPTTAVWRRDDVRDPDEQIDDHYQQSYDDHNEKDLHGD